MALNEFTIISQYFNRHIQDSFIKKGIGDDCAVLTPPAHEDLLFTIDTLNENVHFLSNVKPSDLGYKSLAVSLSDIAAMGGKPLWFMLSMTLPEAQAFWLEGFASGLFELADRYHVKLIGGDTTRGPLAITTQVIGSVPHDQAFYRHKAVVGDDIYITGKLGDAALALLVLQKKASISLQDQSDVMKKFHRPEPRLREAIKLRNIASAAIDISDGLMVDLQHILDSSQVGASIDIDLIPVSQSLMKVFPKPLAMELALTHGDDYELCFTAQHSQRDCIDRLNATSDCSFQRIGVIEAQPGLRIWSQEELIAIPAKGYRHFD